jgi:hypothetical protein
MPKLNCQQRHAVWVERLERFADANVTVAEFCRREVVSVASFYAWRKRLPLVSVAKPRLGKTVAAESKFLQLVVKAATTQPLLRLPGGAAIELPCQLGRPQLTDLIAAVVEATASSRTDSEETR